MLRDIRIGLLALIAVAAALVVTERAAADDPGAAAAFPYAELAALSGLSAPGEVSFTLERAVAVRLRPGLDWPVAAELPAGARVAAAATLRRGSGAVRLMWSGGLSLLVDAITPGGDPWLRAQLSSGATGWLQAANLPPALAANLTVESAPPILARPLSARIAAWPGGDPLPIRWRSHGEYGGHYPVVGRSVDGEWVGLLAEPSFEPAVLWMRAGDVALLDDALTVGDLSIFAGGGTTLIPQGDPAGRAVQQIEPAAAWRWVSEGAIRGEHLDSIWRYDVSSGAASRRSKPRGDSLLSPDGRHLAVVACEGGYPACRGAQDVVLLPLWSGEPLTFADVHSRSWSSDEFWPPNRVGQWSAGGAFLLVPSYAERWNHTVLSTDGEQYVIEQDWLPEDVSCEPFWWSVNSNRTVTYEDQCGGRQYVFSFDGALIEEGPWPTSSPSESAAEPEAAGAQLGDEVELRWSPDRTRAVAIVLAEGEEQGGEWSVGLYRAGDELFEALPVSWSGRSDLRVRWSPTGEALLLRLERRHGFVEGVWLVDVDPLEARELGLDGMHDYVCEPEFRWSPDGRWFAIEMARWSGFPEVAGQYGRDGLAAVRGVRGAIRVYDRGGALRWTFRTSRSHPIYGGGQRAAWSSDGAWLAIGGRLASGPVCGALW